MSRGLGTADRRNLTPRSTNLGSCPKRTPGKARVLVPGGTVSPSLACVMRAFRPLGGQLPRPCIGPFCMPGSRIACRLKLRRVRFRTGDVHETKQDRGDSRCRLSALVILALVVMQLRIGAPTAQAPKDKPAAQGGGGLPRGRRKRRKRAWKGRAKLSRRPLSASRGTGQDLPGQRRYGGGRTR